MRTALGVLILGTALLLTGCGGGGRKVNGKIVKGGQTMTVSEKGVFQLSFIPESGKPEGVTYNATTKSDGTFTILGPESKGIPAGKYKVRLAALDPYSSTGGTDLLKGKFADPNKTPMTIDIPSSGDVTIDVDK